MEMILFLLFVLLAVLVLVFVGRVSTLSHSVQLLETELKDLRRRLHEMSGLPQSHAGPPATPFYRPASIPQEGGLADRTLEMLAIEQQVDLARTPTASGTPSGAPVPAEPSPPPATPERPSRTREEWEELIGGKLLNRIGSLALIIGVGFFLKYAFDNNWLSETVRVLIGVSAGALLLAGAARFRKKGLAIFAQGLVGAGIAILYLSVYASFNFYHLVPQPAAFALMAAVTVIAFTQAFLYEAFAVSLLGWAGGFLTPFLLSTGEVNATGLFTYIALLDAGLLVAIMKRPAWKLLHPLTAGATYLVYALWHDEFYRPADAALTLFFIALLWAIFALIDVAGRLPAQRSARIAHEGTGLANALYLYAAVVAVLHEPFRSLEGTAVACMALVYGLARFASARTGPFDLTRRTRLLLTAVAFITTAVSTQYSGFTVIILWAIEAALLLVASRRWDMKALSVAGLALYGITGLAVLADQKTWTIDPAEFTLLLNSRCAGLLVYALSLGFGARILEPRPVTGSTGTASSLLRYAWALTLFLLLTGETRDLFERLIALAGQADTGAALQNASRLENLKQLSLSGVWLLFSVGLMGVGLVRRVRALRLAAIGLLGVTILKIFLYDLSFLETLYRIFSFIGLGVILLAASYVYQRKKELILGHPVESGPDR